MLVTGSVYLVVATEESVEANGVYEEQNPNESIEGGCLINSNNDKFHWKHI